MIELLNWIAEHWFVAGVIGLYVITSLFIICETIRNCVFNLSKRK